MARRESPYGPKERLENAEAAYAAANQKLADAQENVRRAAHHLLECRREAGSEIEGRVVEQARKGELR